MNSGFGLSSLKTYQQKYQQKEKCPGNLASRAAKRNVNKIKIDQQAKVSKRGCTVLFDLLDKQARFFSDVG